MVICRFRDFFTPSHSRRADVARYANRPRARRRVQRDGWAILLAGPSGLGGCGYSRSVNERFVLGFLWLCRLDLEIFEDRLKVHERDLKAPLHHFVSMSPPFWPLWSEIVG